MENKSSSPMAMPNTKTLKGSQKTLKERAAVSLQPHQEGFLEDKLNEELKDTIQDILYDLMYGGDVKSAVAAIKKNKMIDGIEFTKRALLFGIERQAYEMELISRLLSSCYEIFNDNEIVDGFQLMLFRLPDVVLDVPHAPSILSKFISRAIYDEIIPPIFVKDAHVDNVKAKECMSLAFAKTHSLDEKKEGLEHIWGPGDLSSVKNLKIAVDALLEEYLENPDIKESTKDFVELNVPSFFGEIIKRGLFKSIGMNEKARTDFLKLIDHWFQINLISEGNIKRGFSMAYSQLPNLIIDVPNAGKILPSLQDVAIEKKLLPAHFKPIQ
jgi:programmed cell death protein 4